MEIKENKMGTMPIGKLLATMSGPAILSMLINSLYNIVDSIFVAQVGEKALTAVSLVFPVQMLLVAMGVGTGVGINSLIARRLGAKRFKEANDAASTGIKIGILNWVLFALFGLFLAEWFMQIFSSDQQIIDYGVDYLKIITIFSVFTMTGMITEKIFQSTGNMIVPMITMIIGAVVNIILDPILIFGWFGMPKLEVAGAAWATIIAQLVSCVVGLVILTKKQHAVEVNLFSKDFKLRTVKEIYGVGAPSIIMQALGSIMILGLNGILTSFSATAVAVLGVYGKLQSFIFMPAIGVNQGALPIMAYNYGAKDKNRMMKCYKLATLAAMVIMIVGLIIFQTMPHILLKMFNASDNMYELGIDALRSISWCFIPAAFSIVSAGLFQATGHGMLSMWGSMIRQFVGILPLAFIFGKLWGLRMVWFSFPMAEIIGTAYYILVLKYIYNKSFKNLGGTQDVKQ